MEQSNILDLPPDQFAAALAELGDSIPPEQVDFLTRKYQERQSPMSGLYSFLDRTQEALSGRGMERAAFAPIARPEGVSVAQAVMDGTAEFAAPSSIIDALRGSARAVDTPAAALEGVPYTKAQLGENALSAAGVAMGGGAAFPAPAGALRGNAPSWFGKFTADMTDEEYDVFAGQPSHIKDASIGTAVDLYGDVGNKTVFKQDKWNSLSPHPEIPSWFGKQPHDMTDAEFEKYMDADQSVKGASIDWANYGTPWDPLNPDLAAAWNAAKGAPPPAKPKTTITEGLFDTEFEKLDDAADDIKPFPADEDGLMDIELLDWDAEPEPLAAPPATINVDPPPPSWNGKHVLDMTDEEWQAYKAAGSPVAHLNASVADWKGKPLDELLAEKNAKKAAEDATVNQVMDKLSGPRRLTDEEITARNAADEVAFLLREGRANEVTDELFEEVDLAYLRELYDRGETGMSLPMDFVSRMERAAEMQFNTGRPIYRGRNSQSAAPAYSRSTFTSDNPEVASGYAGPKETGSNLPNVMKLVARGGTKYPEVVPRNGTYWNDMKVEDVVNFPDGTSGTVADLFRRGSEDPDMYGGSSLSTDFLADVAKQAGFKGIRFSGIKDPGSDHWNSEYGLGTVYRAPSNVRVDWGGNNLRSVNANFDPRLSHLRNYSAANASPLMALPATGQSEEDARLDVLRYLESIQGRR